MKAIEINTETDKTGHLKIDIPLHKVKKKVRLMIFLDDEDKSSDNEENWLYAAAQNPSFDFLNEPEEDLYSLKDGFPVHHEK